MTRTKLLSILQEETDGFKEQSRLRDDVLDAMEQAYIKGKNEQLTLTDVVKSLEVFEEIVFEDWLKQHRFTKDINHYIKNNITYREWEVFNMYTMDVYNL